ncbi:MAG: hypothetical protein IJB34_02005, partial [Clostridia bacterium]|nr:hypothetical protein [Clostridia bacterium]
RVERNLRLLDFGILRLTARLTAGLGLRAQTAQGTLSLDPYFQNLTMVKFWDYATILRSKISLRSNFTRVKRISFGVAEFH